MAALNLTAFAVEPAQAEVCKASSTDAYAISQEEANQLYDCLADELAEAFTGTTGIPGVPDYLQWETVSTAPLGSATHGSMLVNHIPNPISADLYKEWEGMQGKTFPVGTIVAKESIRLQKDGTAVVGQLFMMEKVAPGTAADTDDWVYTRIFTDGRVQRTGGAESDKLEFCHDCHAATLDIFDAMFFPPEDFRVPTD